MKNKFIVMIITFVILIGITPFIFSKLMNAKFNTMLLKIQQQEGIKIKEIENKSSYLTTDRIFLVEIPGKKINENFIKNMIVKVETKFKNLPVTNVDFFGNIEKINLVNGENIDSFAKKIKFFVTTPDLKVFNYKVDDINFNVNNADFKMQNIKGVYNLKTITNNLQIKDISLKANQILAELKDINNISSYRHNFIHTENKFNFYLALANNKFQITNIHTLTDTKVSKKTDINIQISFDKFISVYGLINNFVIKLDVLNVDTDALKKFANNYEDKNNIELLKKGLDIVFISKVNNVKILTNNLGNYLIKANIKVKPDTNLEEDIKENNLSFLNSHIYYESSPQIASIIMNLLPQSSEIFSLAKKESNKIILDIKLKDSKLKINGKEIK